MHNVGLEMFTELHYIEVTVNAIEKEKKRRKLKNNYSSNPRFIHMN